MGKVMNRYTGQQPSEIKIHICFEHDELLTKDTIDQTVAVINEMVYDHRRLVAAIPAITEASEPWTKANLLTSLYNNEGLALAFEGNKVVGAMSFVIQKANDKHYASFKLFSVTRRMRGRGVGKQLLDAVSDHARNEGCKSITCGVVANNAAAIRLYETEGFTPMRVIMGKTL